MHISCFQAIKGIRNYNSECEYEKGIVLNMKFNQFVILFPSTSSSLEKQYYNRVMIGEKTFVHISYVREMFVNNSISNSCHVCSSVFFNKIQC